MIETFEKIIIFYVNRIRVMNTDMDYTLLKTGHGLVLCGSTELNNVVHCNSSIINPVQNC